MTPKWLVPDGSRCLMDKQDGFWVTPAVDGVGYRAGLFLMGDVTPKPDRVTAVLLLNVDDECGLRWASGAVLDLWGSMPRAFVRLGLQHGVLLDWRSERDETIQREFLSLIPA